MDIEDAHWGEIDSGDTWNLGSKKSREGRIRVI